MYAPQAIQNKTTALYCRLSRDDGGDAESNSIKTQKMMLAEYAAEKGLDNTEFYIDDGYSGTNFQRPGVASLIEKAQSGEIGCILVKDLSRWGRNYIEVGDMLEHKFPAWGIRFISITDNYDSANNKGSTSGIDIAFRNLVYELYSRDISEKVRSVKITMAKSGKSIGGTAPFGYEGVIIGTKKEDQKTISRFM